VSTSKFQTVILALTFLNLHTRNGKKWQTFPKNSTSSSSANTSARSRTIIYMTGADTSIAGTSWIHFHSWFHYSGNHNDVICFSVFVTWDVWPERLSMLRSVAFWMKDRKFKTKCFGQIMNRPLFILPDFERTHILPGWPPWLSDDVICRQKN